MRYLASGGGLGVVAALAFLATDVAGAQGLERRHRNLLQIVTPRPREVVTEAPVAVSVNFRRRVRAATFRARLNLRDVTARFTVTETGAHARLGPEDGLFGAVEGRSNGDRPGGHGQSGRAPNVILVSISGTDGAHDVDARLFLFDDSTPSASAEIPIEGGSLVLPTYATVSFPAGAFPAPQDVRLSATRSPETDGDWSVSAPMFGAETRTSYELRINSGTVRPQANWEAVLNVPADFAAQVPPNSEIQVFAQVLEDGGEEVLDQFELFPSTRSADGGTVTVTLPPEAFTARRRPDGANEAVILLATTPTRPDTPVPPTTNAAVLPDGTDIQASGTERVGTARPAIVRFAATGTCQGSSLGSPLASREVTSSFNGKTHFGTDYRASDGTEVQAMADGVVERIGFDERPLPEPDPRSGKMVKGWGRYVVIKHQDGSRTLYAHLQEDGVLLQEGASVTKGEALALSDNSGGSEAPHLHVEYAPNGKIYERASKADPNPCVDQNVTGSITVSDNGSAADDAFSVAINGLVVCTTAIGATNTCAVGNLRPGAATLTITAIIAPDDAGTYGIDLADGLTFSDGSTSRSGTLPEGGSESFAITIPSSTTP